LAELRDSTNYICVDHVRPLLASVMAQRIDASRFATVPVAELKRILERYKCREPRVVGLPERRTRLDDFIDLRQVDRDDLVRLSATFARFAARHLSNPAAGEACATRVALHCKGDMALLAAVVARMQVRPAIVDLEARQSSSRVKGHYLRGEYAVF